VIGDRAGVGSHEVEKGVGMKCGFVMLTFSMTGGTTSSLFPLQQDVVIC